MKLTYVFFLLLIFLFSCSKENEIINEDDLREFSTEIRFEISKHLAAGEAVKCIEITDDGCFYASGDKLNFLAENGNDYSVSATSEILSLSFNSKDGSLYLGTRESGLGKLTGTDIQYFTSENSSLPRNLISQVVCDNKGDVWINSSAHKLGGLFKYDGYRFRQSLPAGLPAPGQLIYQIRQKNGKIFAFINNSESGRSIFSISGDRWAKLVESNGCAPTDMEIDSRGNIYYIEDSREYCGGGLFPDPVVFKFSGGEKIIEREHDNQMNHPHLLRADARDYLWTAKFYAEGYKRLSVFDGSKWHEAPQDFPNEFIYCIEVDAHNNIWLGTTNGIYVLNQ